MNFGQAYELLMQGRRVRRTLWLDFPELRGCYLELVQPPPLPDGRRFKRLLMVWYISGPLAAGEFVPWGGLQVDMTAGDWEEVP